MAELTTDQRLSAALLPVLAEYQQQSASAHQNCGVMAERGHEAAAAVHAVYEQRADEMNARLVDLIEGLAAGTVRIVDDYKVVKALEDSFDADRRYIAAGAADSHYSPLRVAQLALQNLEETGAIR